MQSSGDSEGNGVRPAAQNVFHLRLILVAHKGCREEAGAQVKGKLVLLSIFHLSEVTSFIQVAHFKDLGWSLVFFF